MHSEAIIAQLKNTLADVRDNLVQSAGSNSVCAIHKFGSPSDFMKYNEGKEFIIRNMIHLLNRGTAEPDILSFLAENEEKFRAYQSSESTASSPWQAYAKGGLDGIAFIKSLLSSDTSTGQTTIT